ncbi:MAG: transcriptional repressor [Porticoccaceae bacterium]|nr:transcriptional repressor [Porticoccaceae bacterium]
MLTNARLVHQPHDHVRCINAAIAQAYELCANLQVRMTPTREAILRLLWQSHQPLGAYQLQEQLAKVTNKRIAPPTIYRAIEFLLELGLVHRIPSLNAFFGCPFPNSEHSNIFMICDQCKSVAEVADKQINKLLETLSHKANFKLQTRTIELFGLCPNCELGEADE